MQKYVDIFSIYVAMMHTMSHNDDSLTYYIFITIKVSASSVKSPSLTSATRFSIFFRVVL